MAEDGDDMIEGHEGNGFGRGVCAIAVENACIHGEQVSAKVELFLQKDKGIFRISSASEASLSGQACIDDHAVGHRAAVSTLHK